MGLTCVRPFLFLQLSKGTSQKRKSDGVGARVHYPGDAVIRLMDVRELFFGPKYKVFVADPSNAGSDLAATDETQSVRAIRS